MKCPEIIKEAVFLRKKILKGDAKKKKAKIKTLGKSDKIRTALINMSKDYKKYHGDLYFD